MSEAVTRCRVCGRPIRAPASKRSGMGPICARRQEEAAQVRLAVESIGPNGYPMITDRHTGERREMTLADYYEAREHTYRVLARSPV